MFFYFCLNLVLQGRTFPVYDHLCCSVSVSASRVSVHGDGVVGVVSNENTWERTSKKSGLH